MSKRLLALLLSAILSLGAASPTLALSEVALPVTSAATSPVATSSEAVPRTQPTERATTSDEPSADALTLAQPSAAGTGTAPESAEAPSSVVMSVQEAEDATGIDAAAEGLSYKRGEVIVSFKKGVTKSEAALSMQSADAVETSDIDDADLLSSSIEGGTLVGEAGDDPMALVAVGDGQTVVQAVAELEAEPTVEHAQPNYCYQVLDGEEGVSAAPGEAEAQTTDGDGGLGVQSTVVSDPFTKSSSYQYQWQLSNYVSGSKSTGDLGVNAFEAWDYARCNGSVGVAVIDTGCLTSHEDLRDNVVGAYNAYNAVYGGSTTDVSDASGHGTHVCGIVGARAGNGLGGAGVSYNAKLMPVKASDDANGYQFYDSSAIEAYKYIRANASKYNVRVINMSWGGVDSETYEDSSTWKDYDLMQQIDGAREEGILTVCAAGNYNSVMPYVDYPADYTGCVSVINLMQGLDTATMTNCAERDYGLSNYNFPGHKVKNISAPGTDIWSTSKDSQPGVGCYESMSGTSMACPVVAGVAALVFAANPSMSPDGCESIIYGTARDLVYQDFKETATAGWDVYTGYGEVDAAAAVEKALGLETLSPSLCTVTGTYYYSGTPIVPTVTVKNAAGATLVQGSDYSISCSNNVNVGTATVTIVGKGEYIGTVLKTFSISDAYCSDVLGVGSGKAFTIHTRLASGRLVDIAGRSLANGGNAQMYQGNETPAQRFYVTFSKVSGDVGYYTIRNVCSGKVLDVAGGGTANGTNVQQYSSNGTKAQQWIASPSSNGSGFWVLSNVNSGKVLDIKGNSVANGANLQTWTANRTSAQDFAFESCAVSSLLTGSGNSYVIHNVGNTARVVDIGGNSSSDGANIQLYDANGTDAQRFYLEYDAKTGYYAICSKAHPGKVVDVKGAGVANGSNVQQWSSNGTWAQRWSIKVNADGSCTVFCACNGRCFDLKGASVANRTNIWCWDSNGTTAQRWVFAKG
jgi:subtilisin family serine protease